MAAAKDPAQSHGGRRRGGRRGVAGARQAARGQDAQAKKKPRARSEGPQRGRSLGTTLANILDSSPLLWLAVA